LRLIDETRPAYCIIENVSALRTRGLDEVLRGLDAIGFDAEWHCIPATYVGGSHQRDRVWIIANPKGFRMEGLWATRIEESRSLVGPLLSHRGCDGQWQVEPDLRRGPYGFSTRLDGRMNSWGDRLKQCGNSVVTKIPELIGYAILKHEEQK
jgi:DNA (cytosine-5)-methyltransferase 1